MSAGLRWRLRQRGGAVRARTCESNLANLGSCSGDDCWRVTEAFPWCGLGSWLLRAFKVLQIPMQVICIETDKPLTISARIECDDRFDEMVNSSGCVIVWHGEHSSDITADFVIEWLRRCACQAMQTIRWSRKTTTPCGIPRGQPRLVGIGCLEGFFGGVFSVPTPRALLARQGVCL